ncbi:hypothetical protein J3R82DRAFT_1392 [Butyriboletus roseoflavus]|nr:hypothetical protein J3R82DRAFT_1392 [Butyriboletus roseoflavus]
MHSTTRTIFCFWITLLAMAALVVSSPVPEPEPEPAPIDSDLASVIANNLNLGCQNGCSAASSAQQLNTNAALGSPVSPLSVFGGLVLASGVLAAI